MEMTTPPNPPGFNRKPTPKFKKPSRGRKHPGRKKADISRSRFTPLCAWQQSSAPCSSTSRSLQNPNLPSEPMDKAKQSEADFQTAVMTQLALIEERARSPGGYFPRPRLFYHGEPIILLDDVVTGLDVSEKTIRRYRDAGKITVYESREGNIKFVLQSDFDTFLEQTFISSSHPDYGALRKKNKNGSNAGI